MMAQKAQSLSLILDFQLVGISIFYAEPMVQQLANGKQLLSGIGNYVHMFSVLNFYIFSPDNRKFRSKTDVRIYMEQNPKLNLNEQMFDFSLTTKRQRKSGNSTAKKVPATEQQVTPAIQEPVEPLEPPVNEEGNFTIIR